MKYKTRKIPDAEYDALFDKIREAHSGIRGEVSTGTHIKAVDSDFQPTQAIADARYLACENMEGYSLIQIDGIGDMITLEPV